MKKLLLAFVAAVVIGLGASGSAGAVVCLGNAYGCYHWPDASRPYTTVGIDTFGIIPGDVWNQALNASVGQFNSQTWRHWETMQVLNVYDPRTQYQGFQAYPCPEQGLTYKRITVCVRNTGGYQCGSSAPNQWAACTWHWVWNEWNGSAWVVQNHLAATWTDIDSVAGFTWTQFYRTQVLCHEVTGHGNGLGHNTGDPGLDSCLYYQLNTAAAMNTLNDANYEQIAAQQARHNDPSSGGVTICCNGGNSVFKPGMHQTMTPVPNAPGLTKLRRMKDFEGKKVFEVPLNYPRWQLPPPDGETLYITPVAFE